MIRIPPLSVVKRYKTGSFGNIRIPPLSGVKRYKILVFQLCCREDALRNYVFFWKEKSLSIHFCQSVFVVEFSFEERDGYPLSFKKLQALSKPGA